MASTDFTKKVIAVIKKIPKGKVATYAQVAKLAGKPRGVRGVVWILHSCSVSMDLPWQRVINSKGRISFPPMSEAWFQQKTLLKKDGVEFEIGETVDLKKYQWKKV